MCDRWAGNFGESPEYFITDNERSFWPSFGGGVVDGEVPGCLDSQLYDATSIAEIAGLFGLSVGEFLCPEDGLCEWVDSEDPAG